MTLQRPFLASTATSIWETRAWTFQEKILSCKLLIFTQGQCFFQCNQNIFYEDACLEYTQEHAVVDVTPYEGMTNRPSMKPDLRSNFATMYSTLVRGYTRRMLTEDSDCENAFRGILNLLSRLHPREMDTQYWGLPLGVDMFNKALTWRWYNHFPSRRRSLFPSWSWFGRRSDADIRDGFSAFAANVKRLREVLTFYSGGAHQLTWPQDRQCSWKPVDAPVHPPEHVASRVRNTPESHLLYFYTSTASLHVDRTCKELNSRHGCDELIIRVTPSADPIGHIYLNRDWRASRPDTMTFIVLCEYTADDKPASKWDMKSGLIVILIEKTDSTTEERDVSERIQMVNDPILEEDWMAAKPEWKFVTLG